MSKRNGRLILDFKDQRLLVKVVERLREREVPLTYTSALAGDIVISDHLEPEYDMERTYIVVSWEDFEGKCELVKLLTEGRMAYDEIKIGIDPGNPHVIAIVGDREIVEIRRTDNIEDIKTIITKVYRYYPYKHIVVKVGGGSGSLEVVRELYKTLKGLPGLRFQIVDEKDTSKPPIRSSLKTSKKDSAAVNIALKSGVEVSLNG